MTSLPIEVLKFHRVKAPSPGWVISPRWCRGQNSKFCFV